MDSHNHPILQERAATMAHYVFFGPHANCTLTVCDPKYSIYGYIPTFGANLAFAIIFACAIALHVGLGVWSRSVWFMCCMVAGCLDEILGYAGRLWMSHDLWNFRAFMIQVVCISTAPVFFCAAIYVLLAQTVTVFGPQLSRFNPKLFYWVFIICDIISLALQGAGGALSAISIGENEVGVDIALAGLILQVATLVIFCALYADYLWRFFKSPAFQARTNRPNPSRTVSFIARMKVFYAFEAVAVVLILVRCASRVHELRKGYTPSNKMLRHENLFIGLEGIPIVIAVYALMIGHPGLVFDDIDHRSSISVSPKEHERRTGSSLEDGQQKEAPRTDVSQVTSQA
ncbi:Sphingoid long-chain base transporter RSB1 [Cytospora mali]|uniref:Sphingoid long-chain base transporter RSB1 n=1 Tax=Cytospora mali TaxID=578113 RepID=A0A194URU0_CYTMA|nr:Sphingoid long-chain base transporter RSB1 [Valsa mali var. pyri (nom. inval.)]